MIRIKLERPNMTVLVTCAALAVFALNPSVEASAEESAPKISMKRKVAGLDLDKLARTMAIYKKLNGVDIKSLQDLTACPASIKDCDDLLQSSELRDPWGNAFQYNCETTSSCTLLSFGADGLAGGEGEDADLVKNITR